METQKARKRRFRSAFFSRYCQGTGIDIGCGRLESIGGEDKVVDWARGWDKDDGDAHTMAGVPDESQDFVHASHCLEHLDNPGEALKTWFRILKPGGHLILLMPHKHLYEKKEMPPSVWNADHRYFYLPTWDGVRGTIGMKELIESSLPEGRHQVVSIHLAADGYWRNGIHHPLGEYSFETIIRKI